MIIHERIRKESWRVCSRLIMTRGDGRSVAHASLNENTSDYLGALLYTAGIPFALVHTYIPRFPGFVHLTSPIIIASSITAGIPLPLIVNMGPGQLSRQ